MTKTEQGPSEFLFSILDFYRKVSVKYIHDTIANQTFDYSLVKYFF